MIMGVLTRRSATEVLRIFVVRFLLDDDIIRNDFLESKNKS
jgi:hypothetical protein